MRIPIPLSGNHGIARSVKESNQITQNLYPEVTKDGKNPVPLYRIPGLVSSFVADVCRSNAVFFLGDMYFVAGSGLYRIDSATAVTNVGTILTTAGRVSLAGGEAYLMLVDGDDGYTYDGTTFGAIADADFPSNHGTKRYPTHVAYKDGFYVVTVRGFSTFYVSELEDPLTWDGTEFGNAVASVDNTVTVEATDDYLFFPGEYTTEVWFNAGNPGMTFSRAQGGVISWGIQAEWSIAETDNSLIFLGRPKEGDAEVIRVSGTRAEVISTPEISTEINNLSTTSDGFSFVYKQQSHVFYVLTFPAALKTFVFDVTTGLWHTRASKTIDLWRPTGHGYFNGKHYVGSETSRFYTLELSTYTDAGEEITCIRTTAPIHKDYLEITFDEVILDLEGGVGDSVTDPTIVLRYSDDGGKTWSDEMWAQIGKIGNYSYKAHWDQLGASYERIFEFKTTDSFFTAWLGCYARIRVGEH